MQNWLVKALHDLATARKAAAEPDPYLDTAIYHCQQTAEPFEAGFAAWTEAGERLMRYATLYRYPGDLMELDQDEFDQAVADAEGLFQFVLSVLPATVHPVA